MNYLVAKTRRQVRHSCAIAAAFFLATGSAGAMAQDGSLQSATTETEADIELSQENVPDAPVPAGAVGGMGDINLYPRRMVIDRRQRIATVGLYNRVAAPGEYEISVQDMVMTPDGGLVPADSPDAAANIDRLQEASAMLRWSPRRVRLLGNEAQTVRVMARPPADLPDGEYRSHFTVVSMPQDEDEGFSIDDAVGEGQQNSGIGVTIRPRFAISIPVIVRIGETTLYVGMRDIRMIDTEVGPAVRLTLTRSGTRSAYGDLTITAPGFSEPVAVARGVGVYPEVDARDIVVSVREDVDVTQLRSGMVLTVTFTDDDFNPGETLASQEFVVP